MVKTLRPIGNSLGLVIDKPILELLKIDADTPLELTTDGEKLIISPVREDRRTRVRQAHARTMKKHDSAFRKLAR